MNVNETKNIMAVIRTAYPTFCRDIDPNHAVALWSEMFKDDDAGLVAAAVKSWIASDTKGFPPVIGMIKEKVRMLSHSAPMSELEAWTLVKKAIKNSTYAAEKEHAKLPPLIQKIISPEQLRDWAIAQETTDAVNASNFMRSYRNAMNHEEEMAKIPADIRKRLSETYRLEGNDDSV